MSWCQIIGRDARTPFVVTPYVEDSTGKLQPVEPSRGPCGHILHEPCRLRTHHDRERCTGPGFPLRVLYCAAHDVSFTLYPPGHVPHGRRALTPTTEGGQWIAPDPAEDRGVPAEARAFRGTHFDAALDAAQGRIGRREELAGSSEPWWSTQGRQLERGLGLLGLSAEVTMDERHALAELLAVDTLVLSEQASRIAARPGYQQRGRSICAVLSALREQNWLCDRLAECGHRRGLWGAPWRWDPHSSTLRRQPYRLVDTRGPPA